MWVFLSRRLRAWLLLAIAVPALRMLLRHAAELTAARNPQSRLAGVLATGDRHLARLGRGRRRPRRH